MRRFRCVKVKTQPRTRSVARPKRTEPPTNRGRELARRTSVAGSNPPSAQPGQDDQRKRQLLKRYDTVTRGIQKQREVLLRQIQNLRRTRDRLLPRLLSGQVSL